jgi:hypothetical protein
LGLLSLKVRKETKALQHFDTALNYFLLSEDLYGIQAICFNIANTLYKIAIYKFGSKKDNYNLGLYLMMVESWAERAYEITKEAKLGKETVQTEILISITHLERSRMKIMIDEKEKELNLALKYKVKDDEIDMLEIEKSIENKFDLATVQKVIGIVCIEKAKILLLRKELGRDYLLRAKNYLEKAKVFFEKAELPRPIEEINRYIKKYEDIDKKLR